MDININNFYDLYTALQNAGGGEPFNCYIMNDIIFPEVIMLNNDSAVTIINATGRPNVTLSIQSCGIHRHFSTPSGGANNVLFNINEGVILNGSGTGGGVQISGPNYFVSLNQCVISNCVNPLNGGGISVRGITTQGTFIMDNAIIENCRSIYGGGAYIENSITTIIGTSVISANEAFHSGGGILIYRGVGTTIQDNVRIINNTALTGGDIMNPFYGGGGIGIVGDGIVEQITIGMGVEISGNHAVGYGGGIWSSPDSGSELTLVLQGVTIDRNRASFGGGMSIGDITGTGAIVNIVDSVISGNIANVDGGGIHALNAVLSINATQFVNNEALRDGGAIYTNRLETLYIDNINSPNLSLFNGNKAGIYFYWSIQNGGDGELHQNRILTDSFSSFKPRQTCPAQLWNFTNAYNNYDINYLKQPVIVKVMYLDASNHTCKIHRTCITSFLGATVIITPVLAVADRCGTVWSLEPITQMPQTISIQSCIDYTVAFYYAKNRNLVTVTECYKNNCNSQITPATQSIVEIGGNYAKAAPNINGFRYLGFLINKTPPLQNDSIVNLNNVVMNTIVTFIYERIC